MLRTATPASSTRRRSPFGPWEVVALSVALAIAYHLATLEPDSRPLLSLDDGYIHARLGENLAGSGALGINEGSGGGGSSSLLWTLLIAALAAIGVTGELGAAALSFASLVFAVGIATRLAFDLLPRMHAWIASCVIALCGQTVALSLSGMETLLFSGLVIAGLRHAAFGRRLDGTPFFCIAALVRVEAAFAALAVALISRSNPKTRIARAMASVTAAAGGLVILAILGGGPPTTLAARRWLYGMGESLLPGIDLWSNLWTRLGSSVGPGGWIGHVWALSVVSLVCIGTVRICRSRRLASIGLYGVFHVAFVTFVLGDDGQLGRYLAPLWILAPILAASGFEWLHGRWGKAAAIPPLVFLLTLYTPQIWRWADWHRASVEHLRDVHLAMALRVDEAVPPGDSVAAFDIGLLAYVGSRDVVDIGGLADPEMAGAMWHGDLPQVLDQRGVRYVIFPEGQRSAGGQTFAARLGFDLSRLGAPVERTSVRANDLSYLKATKVAMPALALYDLHRQGATPPFPEGAYP